MVLVFRLRSHALTDLSFLLVVLGLPGGFELPSGLVDHLLPDSLVLQKDDTRNTKGAYGYVAGNTSVAVRMRLSNNQRRQQRRRRRRQPFTLSKKQAARRRKTLCVLQTLPGPSQTPAENFPLVDCTTTLKRGSVKNDTPRKRDGGRALRQELNTPASAFQTLTHLLLVEALGLQGLPRSRRPVQHVALLSALLHVLNTWRQK